MRNILNTISFTLIVLFLCALTLNAHAGKRHGYYMGMEVGIAEQEDVDINGKDNDVPTRCDAILAALDEADPTQFDTLTPATLAPGGICERGQDFWSTEGDFNLGSLIGLQLGYAFGNNWRAELEYLHRDNDGGNNENTSERLSDPKVSEIVRGEQGISSISSQSLFANIFYDFTNLGIHPKITPYFGVGAGWSKMRMDYNAVFARNLNPETFNPRTGAGTGTPHVAAGSTTQTRDTLTDTVFGWQAMVGADYDMGNNWSLGVKVRYMHFNDAEDTKTWDALRGHESAVANDDSDLSNPTTSEIRSEAGLENFDPTVKYEIDTEDITVWGVGVNLKYAF